MRHVVEVARWQEAQEAEQSYWKSIDLPELLRIVAEKPAFLKLLPQEGKDLFAGKDVLELGCGPLGLGVVNFFLKGGPVRRLVKVDPLPYMEMSNIPLLQQSGVESLFAWLQKIGDVGDYQQVMGEESAYHQEFDTVVSYNVLDHVQDPLKIVNNGYQALKKGGKMVIGVDCLSVLGRLRFEFVTRRLHKNGVGVLAHPHTFWPGHLVKMMEEAGFEDISILGKPSLARVIAGSHSRPAFIGTKR